MFFPNENQLGFHIIYSCTMNGSFRILEMTSSEQICTRLYTHYGTSFTQLAFELWIKNLRFCVIFRNFLIFHLIKTEEYLAKNLLYWDSSDFLIVWTNCFALISICILRESATMKILFSTSKILYVCSLKPFLGYIILHNA